MPLVSQHAMPLAGPSLHSAATEWQHELSIIPGLRCNALGVSGLSSGAAVAAFDIVDQEARTLTSDRNSRWTRLLLLHCSDAVNVVVPPTKRLFKRPPRRWIGSIAAISHLG
jgi:hypothetical protein